MPYGYTNPFSVCFTSMKLRYQDYDRSISDHGILSSNDEVNVFISFESVLNNLSTIQDLDNKLLLERQFPIILESEMINLCAHYKRFFRGNGLNVKVFLYYTDLMSNDFSEFSINDEYRSFYCNKYLRNPKFQLLGKRLCERIVPRVSKILEFIPDVYFISAKDMDGSLIPAIIANHFPDRKNFIITTDKFESQYLLNPKFCTHFIKKNRYTGTKIISQFGTYISDLMKDENDTAEESAMYMNPSFYTLLMSAIGDKMRSITPLKGIGVKTVTKMLSVGIHDGLITPQTNTIELLKDIFPNDQKDEVVTNFKCTNISDRMKNITDQQIFDITSQIVDQFDFNSLIRLNQTEYTDYPFMLEALTQ